MHLLSKMRHAAILALILVFFGIPRTAEAAEGQKPRLELGTAGMPFAWSTAVGDLDSDKRLDFAIADRTGHNTEGYSYRLKLALSREESQIFQFRSTDSALNVSLLDLDNDADLDVVLVHALSGVIAGVWINNGSGAFHQGNADDFPQAALAVRQNVIVASGNTLVPLAALPLRKNLGIHAAMARRDVPLMPCSGDVSPSEVGPSQSASYRFVRLRAPPTSFPS